MILHTKKKILLLLMILTALLVMVLLVQKPVSQVKRFQSPFTNHYLILYRYNSILPIVPGSSSDLSGFICLYDGNGDLLKKKDVEMLQLVNDVKWTNEKVLIKFVADWSLPSEKN